MTFGEMIAYALILGGLSLVVGYLCIVLPNLAKNKKPKRHHYTEPVTDDYKKSVHANNIDDGSSVDHDKALSSFNH